jgi:hypothetical protein
VKQLIHNPAAVLAAYYAVIAIISGMPEPDSSSGKGYRWAYSSLHIIAANFGKVKAQWSNGGNPLGPVVAQSDQASKAAAGKYTV